jgi:hypothetical protein
MNHRLARGNKGNPPHEPSASGIPSVRNGRFFQDIKNMLSLGNTGHGRTKYGDDPMVFIRLLP